tara:strand:+ start:177 stop:563 length:387 start_codon:yes stop_codon:yes gene_type:complete
MVSETQSLRKRFALFLLLCIPARILLVYLAKYIPLKYLPIMGIIFLIIGCTFLYLNFFDKRKTGLETGGNAIWWNDIRPVHGFLAILFGILALKKIRDAWIVLAIDVLFGLIAFLIFHGLNNNFSKLF